MKKFSYLFTAIAMAVLAIGCDPVEDINEQLEVNEPGISSTFNYTLTEDDYLEVLELSFTSFDSEEEARALIPNVLTANFPVLGENSLANVFFNVNDPTTVESYTALESDYPTEEKYFTSSTAVKSFLSSKYETAEEGKVVELTYKTIAVGIDYTLTEDDYADIAVALMSTYPAPANNLASYGNFGRYETSSSYWSYDMIIEGFNEVLIDELNPNEGQLYNITFDTYGPNDTETIIVRFDGNLFVEFGEAPQGEAYTLVNPDDYAFIGNELLETYPGPADNMISYNNFDRRPDNSDYWSTSMIEEALDVLLQELYGSASEGDVFNVTYRIYDGSAGTEEMTLIKESDSFVRFSAISITDESTIYSYINGEWSEPIMLESSDYTAMGQSFPNFDDEDDVAYKIGIYLDDMFTYAEEGDYKTVGYAFYEDGSTSTKYSNFVFENGGFTLIRDVIETSLQFGNDGTTWVPDNTIEYKLGSADYAFIADELGDTYPNATSSMARYGNMDRRSGNGAFWSDDMILEAFNLLLDDLNPTAEEGQKYAITFDVYNGSNTTETFFLIKTDGVWVMQ